MKSLLKNIAWLFKIEWKYIPFISVARFLGFINNNSAGLLRAFILGLMIDWTIAYVDNGSDGKYLTYSLIAFGFYYLVNATLGVLKNYGDNLTNFKIGYEIPQRMLLEKLNTLSTATLEDPEFQNKIFRYNENSHNFGNISYKLFFSLSLIISFFIAFIPIFRVLPWITILLILSSVPTYLMNRYVINKLWELSKSTTVLSRRSGNIAHMLTDSERLKEIRILNAYGYLKGYFEDYIQKYFGAKVKIYRKWSLMDVLSSILMGAVIILGIYQLINLAKGQEITIGQITFYIAALTSLSGFIDTFSANFADLIGNNIKINEMRQVLDYVDPSNQGSDKIQLLVNPPVIKLENVNFRYPGSDKNVIENLNLEIKPGEKIAIVGENGAGKTTLIKLISNIYNVSEGKISVNGKDLSSINQRSWFENIGVLYQDFNQYSDLTAFENIALGRINGNSSEKDSSEKSLLSNPEVDLGQEINYDQIIEAAKKADAYNFIQDYKDNFGQILNERYEGGIRPSTGQWQKLAIARAFYRNAPVLILDEPTAAIDAVAEANIFDRIYEFINGKTVIIVSHRFSTVRNADRIIVFDNGKIVEQGTHEELMELKGKYHYAFITQAKGYKD